MTEPDMRWADLKERARAFGYTMMDQKLLRIALLKAEIADLEKQVALLQAELDEQE